MTDTLTLYVPAVSAVDLQLNGITTPAWGLQDIEKNTGSEASYAEWGQDTGFSAGYLTLKATQSRYTSNGVAMLGNSIKLKSSTKIETTESGAYHIAPIEATIAFNAPQLLSDWKSSDVVTLLSVLANIWFPDLTGANGTPLTTVVDKFRSGNIGSIV